MRLDDLLDRGDTESANQLLLEIGDAHVETEPFHVAAREVGAEPGALETAAEVAFLFCVAETGQLHVESLRAESMQEPPDRLRASDRHDGDALGVEVAAAALGERFDRALVAEAFDEHDGTRLLHGETVLRDTRGVRDGNGSETLAALLIGWGVNVVALLVVDSLFDGVEIGLWGSVLIGAAVLGIANAIVKPDAHAARAAADPAHARARVLRDQRPDARDRGVGCAGLLDRRVLDVHRRDDRRLARQLDPERRARLAVRRARDPRRRLARRAKP